MTDLRETIARAICEAINPCFIGGCSIGVPPASCMEREGDAVDAVLSAIEAAGMVVVPSGDEARRGLEWFERTFGVPLGDKPGLHDVQRVRAMIAAATPLTPEAGKE